MITKTAYWEIELETGECTRCSEQSEEILIGDGRCVDCIEEQKFYDESMKIEKEITSRLSDLLMEAKDGEDNIWNSAIEHCIETVKEKLAMLSIEAWNNRV